jgi:hypothetical protein
VGTTFFPEQTLDQLVFPELASIQLVTGPPSQLQPIPLGGVIFAVCLIARSKSDYTLAPFATDAAGLLTISREACECFVDADHDSGLMDYAGVGQCSPRVEIRLWSAAEVERAANARRRIWRKLLRGEDRLFQSIEELIAIYDRAPNARLSVSSPALRPIWNGSELRPSYQYIIDRVAPT